MTDAWRKILNIVRKTGDRCIVVHENGDDAFVVMPLESYEALIGNTPSRLTAQKFTDKIEPDMADSKSRELAQLEEDDFDSFSLPSEKEMAGKERFYLEPIE